MTKISTIIQTFLILGLVISIGIFSGCDAGSSMESNEAPTADATVASNQPYNVGNSILLEDTASFDPDQDSLRYSWSLSTPSGSNSSLGDDDAAQTTFTPDAAGDYTASLQVSDGEEQSTDDVTVTVAGSAPNTNSEISSDITSDRTLSANVDYEVTTGGCVKNNSTLTIEPGTDINFRADAALVVCGDGSALVADGKKDSTITMTATSGNETEGWWEGVGFRSGNPNNSMKYVTIRHAGSGSHYKISEAAGLALNDGSELAVQNCTFEDNENYGLHLDEGTVTLDFANNTFAGNTTAPVNIPFVNIADIDSGSSFENGSFVRIWDANPSSGSHTVDALSNDVSYRIAEQVGLDGDTEMTICAGVEMTFAANTNLTVNDDNAALIAEGTASDSIRMTATPGNEDPGWWEGVGIRSTNQNNKMEYVAIRHAGSQDMYKFSKAAGLALNKGSRFTLKNSTIEESGKYGLHVDEASVTLDFANTSFKKNEDAPVSIPFTNIGDLDRGSEFASGSHVRVWEATLSSGSHTAAALTNDVPYRIIGKVGLDDTADLTIDAGVEMTFAADANLTVNSNDAYLAAEGGSGSDQITMTGTTKQRGWWEGIGIRSSNDKNILEYVVVRHRGKTDMYRFSAATNVGVDKDSKLEIKDVTIEESGNHGVYCDAASAELTESGTNTIQNNDGSNMSGC